MLTLALLLAILWYPHSAFSQEALFVDVPINHWAADALQFLADRGIITGMPDGTFQGDRSLSRYEASVLVFRAVQFGLDELIVTAQDLETLENLTVRLADRLRDMGQDVGAMQQVLDEARATIESNFDDLLSVKDLSVEAFRKALDVERRVAGVTASEAILDDVNVLIDPLERNVSDLIDLSGQLLEDTADNERKIAILESDLEPLNERVDTLESDLTLATQSLRTNTSRAIVTNRQDIIANQQDVATLQTTVSDLESRVSNNQTDLAATRDLLDSVAGRAGEALRTATELSDQVAALGDQVAALDVAAVSSRVNTNRTFAIIALLAGIAGIFT